MTNATVLIVDDEAPARRRIRQLLEAADDFQIVGEAANGAEALEMIAKLRPQVVFLDVQMPELNGFEVLRALPTEDIPRVVFVTAFDEYALDAFEVCAIDYLLKPFDADRFSRTLDRLREVLGEAAASPLEGGLRRLLQRLEAEGRVASRFVAKSRGRMVFVKPEEIDWVEAAANYAEFHVGERSYLIRETLDALQDKLDPQSFVRIHRSRIVNIDRVREIHPWEHGDYAVVLENGVRLRMSRRYKANIDRLGG